VSDVCLSRTWGLVKVGHVTRDSDITFKVKGQLAHLAGHIVAASRTAYYAPLLG